MAKGAPPLLLAQLRRHVAYDHPYFYGHLGYILSLILVGGTVIYAIEGGNASYVDALFTAASSVCCVGHTILDPTSIHSSCCC